MAQHLRICLISYEFPPEFGGEGTYTYGLFKSLLKRGHEVVVVTTNNRSVGNVISVPSLKISPFKLISFRYFCNKTISSLINNRGMDIIHFTNDYFEPIIPHEAKDIPIILTIHHPFHTENMRFKHVYGISLYYLKYWFSRKIPYLKRLNNRISMLADSIITVSKCTASEICNLNKRAEKKITIIPNAVDTERFNPDIDISDLKIRIGLKSQKNILFVGRLDYTKGIIHLIKAFKKLVETSNDDLSLLIAGSGPLERFIIAFIEKNSLKGKVLLLGKVTDNDIPALYNLSDIVVLPSIIEGFGIVLLEAMATGKTCIATKACGTEEVVVDTETGVLVPCFDIEALFKALQSLISNPEQRLQYGRAGLKRVNEKFTWEKVVLATEEVYFKAIEKKRWDQNKQGSF